MTTLERKLAIWRHLATSPSPIRLRDLAQRFEVSKNTAQRDIDDLSRAGVPIEEVQDGQTNRFTLRKGPNQCELSAEERGALSIAGTVLTPWAGTPWPLRLARASDKLQKKSSAHRLAAPTALAQVKPEVLDTLEAALAGGNSCRITYRRRGATRSREYQVSPMELLLAEGLVYLRAVAHSRGYTITFACHLIESATMGVEDAMHAADKSSGFRVFEGAAKRVVVRFAPEIAPYIEERSWHPSQRLTLEDDGSLRFEARVSGMYEFVGWVMSWGHRAQLIKPLAWRQELLARATKIIEQAARTALSG